MGVQRATTAVVSEGKEFVWKKGKECAFSLQLVIKNQETEEEFFLPNGSFGWDLGNVRENNEVGMFALESILNSEECQALKPGKRMYVATIDFPGGIPVIVYLKRNGGTVFNPRTMKFARK